MKYGSESTRNTVANELKGTYVELAKSKYGKFIVKKVLKYW
jgi:pumilio family protein 6